jgi:hypothetical protein
MKNMCAKGNPQVLLIAEQGDARQAYCRIVRNAGVDCLCVDSLKVLYNDYVEVEFSGLLLDVPTVIKSSLQEKEQIQELVERFPVVRLRWDPDAQSAMGLYAGGSLSDNEKIGEFLKKEANGFTSRRIRSGFRHCICFNVLLYRDSSCACCNAEKAFTANASLRGCFVCTSQEYGIGEKLYIRIFEIEDQAPISAQVCWRVSWGQELKTPGIGISFLDLSAEQEAQIKAFF